MNWSVRSAKYLNGYRLAVTFADGQSGVVDLEPRLRRLPIFRRLLDVNEFKKFQINPDFGVLCWGEDLDIAPETLYEEATSHQPVTRVAETPAQYAVRRKK